jgi:hypothetical protein
MIKANDLRIGSWIDLKNSGYIKVDADNIGDVVNNPAIFDPILLTPEILEKAGFEKQRSSDNVLDNYFIGENPITHDWIMSLQWIDGRESPFYKNGYHQIKYLHQLQNLFYSLTGKELEINLSEKV